MTVETNTGDKHIKESSQGEQVDAHTACRYANIPQPLPPMAEGEQDSKSLYPWERDLG